MKRKVIAIVTAICMVLTIVPMTAAPAFAAAAPNQYSQNAPEWTATDYGKYPDYRKTATAYANGTGVAITCSSSSDLAWTSIRTDPDRNGQWYPDGRDIGTDWGWVYTLYLGAKDPKKAQNLETYATIWNGKVGNLYVGNADAAASIPVKSATIKIYANAAVSNTLDMSGATTSKMIIKTESTSSTPPALTAPNLIVPASGTIENHGTMTVTNLSNEGKIINYGTINVTNYSGSGVISNASGGTVTGVPADKVTVKAPEVGQTKIATFRLAQGAYNGVYAQWNKVAVSGSTVKYKVEYKVGTGNWQVKSKGQTANNVTIKGLAAGKAVQVRVTPFITFNGKTISSAAKTSKQITTLKKVNLKKVQKVTKNGPKVKLSWDKVANASGYQIYRSKKQNGKYTLVTNVKPANATWTVKTQKGVKYWYKVRAYNNIKVNGKTVKVFGPYSTVKALKY